jgi:hypothetical protein
MPRNHGTELGMRSMERRWDSLKSRSRPDGRARLSASGLACFHEFRGKIWPTLTEKISLPSDLFSESSSCLIPSNSHLFHCIFFWQPLRVATCRSIIYYIKKKRISVHHLFIWTYSIYRIQTSIYEYPGYVMCCEISSSLYEHEIRLTKKNQLAGSTISTYDLCCDGARKANKPRAKKIANR